MDAQRMLKQYQQVGIEAQIMSADPHRIIQMLLIGAMDRVAAAKGHVERNELDKKHIMIGKAINIVMGLKGSINHQIKSEISTEKSNFLSNPGWQLQFGYDAVRFPLWTAAYCQQPLNQNKPLCATLNKPSTGQASYFSSMTEFVHTRLCTTSTGLAGLNPNGYWAFPVPGANDGAPVDTASQCDITPAFLGPMAVLAKKEGQSELVDKLNTSLSSYDLRKVTPLTAAQESNYTSTSAPYFNGSLLLISQALLVGNGSFDLSNAPAGSGFASKTSFMANYQAWKSSGFLANFSTTDKNGKTHLGQRVIFSTVQAPSTEGGNVGKSPTVSEGMGYGLLIAYAANDQETFDKFLHYVFFVSQVHGCAGVADPSGETCNIQSSWLMPWMVDETGRPFHYTVGGGYMTNGSATDADIQIAWALSMAQQRVDSGKWENTTFAGPDGSAMGYGKIFTAMAKDIARYDINPEVSYLGEPVGALYGPGSQWGAAGKGLIFPGYITPEAFDALGLAS